MSVQCVHPISVVPRISWTNVAPSSKHDPMCAMSFQSKSSVCFTIPFVPCRLSVFIPSRWHHASRGQTWHPRASMAHFFPSTFSQSVVCVSLNPRASTIPCAPIRLSVFIPCRWYHDFRGQTWHPLASTTQSVSCLFSQSLLCVSRSHLCHVGSVCSSHLGGTTHLVDKRGALEQAWPTFCHLRLVKVSCVFLLTLEQARSNLRQFGSVCSSHLGGTSHLVDKRGALEQAWPTFFHLRLVKVLCVFLLALEQARSHLCHVGSVCSSHLGGTTHLVDKRGALEQAWPTFFHLRLVKVLCVFLLTLEQARSSLRHVGSVCSSHLVDKRGTLEQARSNLCHVFSVKVLCVFLLTLEQARSHLCHVGSVCSSHLGGTTHLVDKRGTLEQAWPNLCHVFSVKVLCVFLLTLEQARSHLCHVGSVCSSHLGGTTHLVDKRGTLEQARPNLWHVFSVKVFFVFLLTLERVRSHLCHFSSVRVLCVSQNSPASRIRSVLCWSTVFLLASEKACRHRTSTIQSLLCLLSVLFFDRKCMLTLDDLSWAGDAISHSPLNNFIGSLRSRDHKRGISISSSVHACCFWWTAMR